MKRIRTKLSRRDFVKTSAFVSASAAGAGLMVGANPELEIAAAHAQVVVRVLHVGAADQQSRRRTAEHVEVPTVPA